MTSISAIIINFLFFSAMLTGCTTGAEAQQTPGDPCLHYKCVSGAIVRGDTSEKKLALVFTGDEFAEGGDHILSVLKRQQVPGSFFFTGNFYRDKRFEALIRSLLEAGCYLGAHSDRHLLYCDWERRDSLLVTKKQFVQDLQNNYLEMSRFGISKEDAPYFLPPYEWYNDSISSWTKALKLQLINYTPGTLSHADYTTPDMPNYKSSADIYNSIIEFEREGPNGLKGFILLSHIGTAPERKDKFYSRLNELITRLKAKGYRFQTVDRLLGIP